MTGISTPPTSGKAAVLGRLGQEGFAGVSGVRTARTDIDLIHERLKTARADYEVRYAKKK